MTAETPRRSRLVPALIMAVGLIAAGVMVWLGLWQAQVFVNQGHTAAEQLASGPVQVLDGSITGDEIGALWGHRVSVSGSYVASQQILVVDEGGGTRVLSAFQLTDGRVVAIVRGTGPELTTPPAGTMQQQGVFLPTEAAEERSVPAGQLASVRLQAVAQVWPQPLVAGYLTLDADAARAQQMTPAEAVLPRMDGSSRNGGYALQWWVFAAFALIMSAAVARNYSKRGLAMGDDPADEPADDPARDGEADPRTPAG